MFDLAIFTALGWERRAVARGLVEVEPAGPRSWRGRLGDGASCLLVQTGVGPERARAAALALPAARVFLACGCAGALADWLRAGDLVAGAGVRLVDADGRSTAEPLPAHGEVVAAWAAGHGFRVHRGPIVSSPVVLLDGRAKTEAGVDGALVVEMESAALAAEARARGIPLVALRVVLDVADQKLPPVLGAIDEATGELRLARAVGGLASRPWLWGSALRLGRQSKVAERRLTDLMTAVLAGGMEALLGVPESSSVAAN